VTAYQEANVWKDFYNITGGGLSFNVNVNISTLGSITAPASGLYPANTNITLTATPVSSSNFIGWTTGNGDPISNEPTLNFLLTDNTVITAVFGNTGNYPITAGTLKDIAGIETVTHLTLTGEIDARDVKFMRDDMPYLTELDLSGATIVAYEGKDGTYPWEYPSSFLYPANEMPNLAFYNGYQGKTSLTSIILPNGLNSIGSGAFTYCSGLTSINIPAGVDSIKDAALYSAGLTSINIPVGVTFIGEFVFGGCHRLTSIILPDGLTSIEDYAFAYCNNLTTITNLNPVPQSINSNVFEGVDKSACELHVSSSLYNAYSTADVWKEFHVVSVNMYTVNTNSDNGSATGSGIYEANTSVTVIATPSSGYQFKDWTSNQTTVSSKNPYTFTVTQDIDLTANFEAIAYNIRYELDGGVNHPENPSTYTINDSISLKAPSRDDYLFVGWSNDGIIAKGATGEQTFTASWQHNNIVITINGEEVDISNSANDSVFEYTVKECDESSIQLDLGALPNTTITVDGVEQQGSEITLQGDITTVNINIESIDKDYTLKISSPITGDLYHRRWDDVIAINRNHETNGGHNVSDIQWYHKDGTSAGGGDYLELSNNKTLDDYYSNVKTVETDAWHRVCATETKSTAQIIAYPNPVPRGGKVTVQLPESFVGSVLKVYDIKGSLVKSDISLPVTINNIDVSEHTPGIYLLQVSDRNGNRQTVKIIIE
jgi:uncharacterized repeat protein (TIGR02543 family)